MRVWTLQAHRSWYLFWFFHAQHGTVPSCNERKNEKLLRASYESQLGMNELTDRATRSVVWFRNAWFYGSQLRIKWRIASGDLPLDFNCLGANTSRSSQRVRWETEQYPHFLFLRYHVFAFVTFLCEERISNESCALSYWRLIQPIAPFERCQLKISFGKSHRTSIVPPSPHQTKWILISRVLATLAHIQQNLCFNCHGTSVIVHEQSQTAIKVDPALCPAFS